MIPIDQKNHPKADARFSAFVSELGNEANIVGVERIPYFDTSNELVRYLRYFKYIIQNVMFGVRSRKEFDIILCEHTSFGLIGGIVSAITGKPLVWDTLDGNILAHCRLLGKSRFYMRLNSLLELFIGNIAKCIVVMSPVDRRLYEEQHYRHIDKIKVIPSAIDLSAIDRIRIGKEGLRAKLGLDPNKVILLYSGKREYGPNKIAAFWINDELAPELAKRFDNIQILITGTGEMPKTVHDNVSFLGHVDKYFEYILASDLCLVPYDMDTGISTKLIDYLACGRPTVVKEKVARLMPELVDGYNVISAQSNKEFTDRVSAFLSDSSTYANIGKNALNLIRDHYDLKKVCKTWDIVLRLHIHGSKAS